MRRHLIHIPSPLQQVLEVLRGTGLAVVELTGVDQGLLHVEGGAGLLHYLAGSTTIEVLEFDEGPHVSRIVAALRDARFRVDHSVE